MTQSKTQAYDPVAARGSSLREYQPRPEQDGKDVVWLPTQPALLEKMLDLANLTPNDFVIDLGSGDGRTVIAAAKRGVRALGIEFNPDLVELSKRIAFQEGVADQAAFLRGDIFECDFSQATVLTLFLHPDLNCDLRSRILDMKPGVRVLSNSFEMGSWTPDQRATVLDCGNEYCTAYCSVVPAKVEGTWRMSRGQIVFEQKFQKVTGAVKMGRTSTEITHGKLAGDRIAFTAGDTRYTGRVDGGTIEGVRMSENGETKWRARRVKSSAQ